LKDREYVVVYKDDENFQFCTIMPAILSFNHHEIQEFARNDNFSAILAQACSTKILSLLNLCDTIQKLIL
jgi:hypothetical protein